MDLCSRLIVCAGVLTAGLAHADPPRGAPLQQACNPAEMQKALPQVGDRCVRAAETFPGLLMVGSFAYDRGCMLRGYVWDCAFHDGMPPSRVVLESVEWHKTRGNAKKQLALAYVHEVHLLFRGTVSDEPTPPRVTLTRNGGAIVTVWLQDPPGRRPGWRRRLLEVTLAKDGTVTETTVRTTSGR